MTNVPVDAWIRLYGTSDVGGTLSWTSIGDNALNTIVIDVDGDGNADIGADSWQASGQDYTGYTINVGGTDYPVFLSGGIYVIPYNTGVEDISGTFPASGSTSTIASEAPIPYYCFLTGTKIATPSGAVNVEALRIGDVICTADGGETAVMWLAHQKLNNHPWAAPKMAPVCISAGALGNDLPHCDLTVTADHGMILEGLVINASALVNGDTIDFVPLADLPTAYTVYHIETDAHDIILANGAPSETFMDAAGRAAFDNHQEYLDLYGAERIIPEMPRPRINAQRLLPDTIKAQLGVSDLRIVTLSA